MDFNCDDVTMRDDKKNYRHGPKAFRLRGLISVCDDVTIKSHTYPYREKESAPKKGIIFRWKLVAEFIVTFVRIIPFPRGKSPFCPEIYRHTDRHSPNCQLSNFQKLNR